MKKLGFAFVAALSLSLCAFSGCGKGENKVIEAPPAEDTGGAMEGMDDDEYNKEMEKAGSQQG